MLQKSELTSTTNQSRNARPWCESIASVHLPVKMGREPCSAAYRRARWRRDERKPATETATEHDDAAWSRSREPTCRPPDCSAEGRRVAWESTRRRRARSRPRRGRGGILQDGLFLGKMPSERRMLVVARTKGVPSAERAGPEPGPGPASIPPSLGRGTPLEVGELETRPGAGSALCISRGQGTGGPTGRPTPNQPVGAVSTMPLHPLDRKSAAQPLPSGFAAYYFRPWTR